MSTSITPATMAELKRLASVEGASGKPILMLNLLRFGTTAHYNPPRPGTTGRDAFKNYNRAIAPILGQVGGSLALDATAELSLIAPEGEKWDTALLVRYPSASAFLSMITSPEYLAIVHHRSAAVEDSRLILLRPRVMGKL